MSEFIEAIGDPYDDSSYLSYRLTPQKPNAGETVELEVRFGYTGAERLNDPDKLYEAVCVSCRRTNGSTMIFGNVIDDISELDEEWVGMENMGVFGHTDDGTVEYNVYRRFLKQIPLNDVTFIEVHVQDNDPQMGKKAVDVAFQVFPDPFADAGIDLEVERSPDETLVEGVLNFDARRVEEALKAGANPNLKKGKSSMYKLARFESEHIAGLLIEYGAENDEMLNDMERIISSGRTGAVEILVKKGVEFPAKPCYGPPVFTSAKKNRIDMVNFLAAQGLDLNEGDRRHTPLTIAIMQNDRDMACRLLELGSDPNALNPDGMTPLALAVCENSIEVVEALLERGADGNQMVEGSAIASHVNMLLVSKFMLELSYKNKENPPLLTTDIRDVDSTPLTLAAQLGHTEVAKVLLEAKVDPLLEDGSGITPMDWAEKYFDEEIQILLNAYL